MKIMAVITGMKSGGAERVMATLCNEFSKNNEVRLIILKEEESDYEISDRVDIIAGNIKHKNVFKSIFFVKKQIINFEPDVVLSFMTNTNIVTLVAKKISKRKCPVIISVRANPDYSNWIYYFFKKLIFPIANGCVFQTKQAQECYKNILKCNSVVIRNPLSRDFNIKPYTGIRNKKIVCTARLSTEKNQQLLIRAFDRIKDKYPDFRVEIYGEGPDRGKLQSLIEKLNIEHQVILMGRKKNIIECIQDASIFVLPSNSEGMPNSLLEAMALGIPSISTDCPIGGPSVIVNNNENGVLIPMNDENALISAIERIINDKDFADKISKNGTHVVDDFNTEKVCKEWEDYLKSFIKSDMIN